MGGMGERGLTILSKIFYLGSKSFQNLNCSISFKFKSNCCSRIRVIGGKAVWLSNLSLVSLASA